MGTEMHSLVHMVQQVEASDGVLVEVTLLCGGVCLTGWLISGVRYREILAQTVRAGSAAACAPDFDQLTDIARSRRKEIAHHSASYPGDPPPAPEFLHLLEGEGSTRTWCLPLGRVDAWSMDSFNIAVDGE